MILKIRRQPCQKAYTIVESLVVLVILTVITMVLLALLKRNMDPDKTTDKPSAAAKSAPAEPLPPAINDDQTE